ncbi:MAG: hypothetical protein A2148_04245 [Chloroflexi bacterium RBG_16_68_14]|nr:MAG: hypothetical protein A2148_04245 [Chloroflexi bacterium RBG_16_68_14]
MTAVALERYAPRESMPQIVIQSVGGGFAVSVGGQAVRFCGDELGAHHWGKHAFEAVNQGLRRPGEIGRAMRRLCLIATRHNLHH